MKFKDDNIVDGIIPKGLASDPIKLSKKNRLNSS